MTFSVDPVAVKGLADMLDRACADADAARRYAWEETDLELTGEGLINLLTGGHLEARRGVTMWLGEVRDHALGNAAAAVRAALSHYQRTDRASADRVDRTLPGADTSDAREGLPSDPTPVMGPVVPAMYFTDQGEPQDALRPPPDYNDEMPYSPTFTDLASPTALVRQLIVTVTGFAASIGICDRKYDVAEIALKPMVGDWAGLRACADVHRSTGRAVEEIGRNVLKAVHALPQVWQGNAADACLTHLAFTARVLLDSTERFEALAREYEGAARGAKELSGALGNLLNDMGDAALVAASSGAVVAASGSTGFGLPLAIVIGGAALTKTWFVVRSVAEILKEIGRFGMYLSGINSAIEGLGRVDSHLTLPTVPAIDRSALPSGTR